MLLTQDKIKLLLETLVLKRDDEVDCDECFDSMAEFAESQLSGQSVPEALRLIEGHIQICGDCQEEFNILKESIKDLNDDDSSIRIIH